MIKASCFHLLPYLVVCPEVVDLLPEHTRPEVFADELHDVQLIFEARRVLRQSRKELKPSELVTNTSHFQPFLVALGCFNVGVAT